LIKGTFAGVLVENKESNLAVIKLLKAKNKLSEDL
jgi:hypothetical protein